MTLDRRTGLALLLGSVLSAILFGGCTASWSSDQGKTISPDGAAYSYRVPHGWLIDHGHISYSANGRQYKTAVDGQGDIGAVVVSQEDINVEVTSANLQPVESEFKRVASAWENPASGFRARTIAGAPALEYRIDDRTSSGDRQYTTEAIVFKGHRVFYVSCVSKEEGQSEVAKACDEVKHSLELS